MFYIMTAAENAVSVRSKQFKSPNEQSASYTEV